MSCRSQQGVVPGGAGCQCRCSPVPVPQHPLPPAATNDALPFLSLIHPMPVRLLLA